MLFNNYQQYYNKPLTKRLYFSTYSIKPPNPQNKNHFIIVIFACYFYSDCRKNNLPLQKVEAKPE